MLHIALTLVINCLNHVELKVRFYSPPFLRTLKYKTPKSELHYVNYSLKKTVGAHV